MHADRRRRRPRPSPGSPTARSTRFTLCVESWFDGERLRRGRPTTAERPRAAGRPGARRATRSPWMPRRTSATAARTWIVRSAADLDRARPQPQPRRVRRAARARSSTATPAIQVRYVHEIWGTATAWATVTPRAGSAPVPGAGDAGACRACVGGSDLVAASATRPRTPPAARPRSRSATPACATTTPPARCCRTRADTWAVPVGAVRVEGITVSVDWSAQGWGLSPATATFSASCDPNNPPAHALTRAPRTDTTDEGQPT